MMQWYDLILQLLFIAVVGGGLFAIAWAIRKDVLDRQSQRAQQRSTKRN